jgi:hypothetical protein
MTVQVLEQIKFGRHDATITEVSGTACVTGRNEFTSIAATV